MEIARFLIPSDARLNLLAFPTLAIYSFITPNVPPSLSKGLTAFSAIFANLFSITRNVIIELATTREPKSKSQDLNAS